MSSYRARELDVSGLSVGNHRKPCPHCGRGAKDKALSVTINADGSHVAHCFRCSLVQAGGRSLTVAPRPPARPKQIKRNTLSAWGHNLWSECRPISGTAAQYLQARQCLIPPSDGDLRWHPQLKHRPSGYVGPALVALITDARTGQPLSLHRTWVCSDGTKATDPAKMMLPGHATVGGVIRLWPDDSVTYSLGVAEGIETALTLAWAHRPVWALIDAGHLAKFTPLPGIETLAIARDNDAAGIAAARQCVATWSAAWAEVFTTRQAANDLNDVARGLAA